MSRTLHYRQNVNAFRERLNEIQQVTRGSPVGGEETRRTYIDTTKNLTITVPFTSPEERLGLYGQARHYSAARVLTVFELAREEDQLHNRTSGRVRATPHRAVWQAFRAMIPTTHAIPVPPIFSSMASTRPSSPRIWGCSGT